MEHQTVRRQPGLAVRAATLGALFIACAAASYGVSSTLRAAPNAPSAPAPPRANVPVKPPFESGRYLVAFVFVSSDCGFSRLRETRRALREFPDSLRAANGSAFTDVSVIGVSIDKDVDAGLRFLRDIEGSRHVFDEISVGRSWLNEQVVRLVWREGMATANLPQIVLVERQVDMAPYPRHIGTERDSVLLNLTGSKEIAAWVGKGAPLRYTKSAAAS